MSGELPSVWRATRVILVALWIGFAGIVGSVLWRADAHVTGLAGWWPFIGIAAAVCAATTFFLVQAPWRVQRAMRAFTEVIPGPYAADVDRNWVMVLRWRDVPLEVRGSAGWGVVWAMKARVDGDEVRFDPWAAPVIAREMRARLGHGGPVGEGDVRPVPWGFAHFLSVASPLVFGIVPAAAVDAVGFPQLMLPAGVAGAALAYALLVWGRVNARRAVARFAHALADAGRVVDGPHLSEAGFAPRYACFTDRGVVTVQVPAFGPLAAMNVRFNGEERHVKLAAAADVAREAGAALADAPAPVGGVSRP